MSRNLERMRANGWLEEVPGDDARVHSYRQTENGISVDATGEILGGGDLDGTFDGALELSSKLANSRSLSEEQRLKWGREVLGR